MTLVLLAATPPTMTALQNGPGPPPANSGLSLNDGRPAPRTFQELIVDDTAGFDRNPPQVSVTTAAKAVEACAQTVALGTDDPRDSISGTQSASLPIQDLLRSMVEKAEASARQDRPSAEPSAEPDNTVARTIADRTPASDETQSDVGAGPVQVLRDAATQERDVRQEKVRAYRFVELGVFGSGSMASVRAPEVSGDAVDRAGRAAAVARAGNVAIGPSMAAAELATSRTDRPLPAEQSIVQSRSEAAAVMGRPATSSRSNSAVMEVPIAAQAGPVTSQASVEPAVQNMPAESKPAVFTAAPVIERVSAGAALRGSEPQERAAPMPPLQQTRSNPGPVNLVVSGQADKLVVATRIQALTPEDLNRLRSRLEEVAREFGVELSELYLNGEFAEHVSEGGGAHGGFVR